MSKQLWILAGGNGAGKSTFFDRYLKPKGISFINADLLAKDLSEKINPKISKIAQDQAWARCMLKLDQGEPFCFETVFSHDSKIELVNKAKELGYSVVLVFIHLNSATLNIARVHQRVQGGGHAVPHKKIEARIPRSLKNIKQVLAVVDQARLIDNSSPQDPFRQIAKIINGKVVDQSEKIPAWALSIMEDL